MLTYVSFSDRYLIKTKEALDRETKRIHNIEIEAWDLGRPSLSSTKVVEIELFDENDNAPTFGKSFYQLSVKENVKPGSTIATLKAEDIDDGVNANITYSAKPLRNDTFVPFAIDPDTGEVYFITGAQQLDAENATGPFELLVVATDNGQPRRNASTILKVQQFYSPLTGISSPSYS